MEIFISWSKDKSRLLAVETKKFILNALGNKLEVFFSPDMYKGTSVDNEIHNNLQEEVLMRRILILLGLPDQSLEASLESLSPYYRPFNASSIFLTVTVSSAQ